MKKIISVFLIVFMCVSLLSVAAFAEEGDEYAYDTEYYSKLKDKNINKAKQFHTKRPLVNFYNCGLFMPCLYLSKTKHKALKLKYLLP